MDQAQLHIFHRIIIILSSAVRLVFRVLGRVFGLTLNKAKSHVNVELYANVFCLIVEFHAKSAPKMAMYCSCSEKNLVTRQTNQKKDQSCLSMVA